MINLIYNQKVRYLLLPFLGGIFYAFGFPNKLVPYSAVSAIIGTYFLISCFELSYDKLREETFLKRELISFLLFSLSYCLVGYYWLPYTIGEFGKIFFPFNYLLSLSFSLIILPQFLVFIILHHFICKFKFKTSVFTKSVHLKTILYAFILSLLEYYVPQQFPAHLGHTWLQFSPFLGLAPFVGAPVYSFFSYLLIFSLIAFTRTQTKDFFAVSATVIFLILNLLIPLNPLSPKTTELQTNIRMIQANIGNFLKVSSEKGTRNSLEEIYYRYTSLSTKPSKNKLDLIIWPETAYPHLQSSKGLKEGILPTPKIMREVIDHTGAYLFTGGYDSVASKGNSFESEYNSAFHFNSQAELKGVYHKIKLIPFGESLPFGPFNRYIRKIIRNIAFFASGDSFPSFTTKSGSRFISAICYEILFSSFIRDYLNSVTPQPHFLVNLTNDSWYGDTIQPFQHIYLAKWRALEFNLPIVRMTNTGISSVIYPNGSESRRTGIHTKEILDIKLTTPKRERTPFQRFGIFILFFIWIALVITINIMTLLKPKST